MYKTHVVGHWPEDWDLLEAAVRELSLMTKEYRVTARMNPLSMNDMPEYIWTLERVALPIGTGIKPKDVIGEYTDIHTVVGIVKLLIEAENQAKNRSNY
jgi:hypothetical protein